MPGAVPETTSAFGTVVDKVQGRGSTIREPALNPPKPHAPRLPRPYHRIVPDRASRFRGSLLGGAVGDALGAPVEFMSLREIQSQFGPDGIRDFHPDFGRYGSITDDTQMTLFTAEGLLRAHVQERTRGLTAIPAVVAHAYQRWLITQGVVRRGNPTGMDGWLIQHRELFSVRAPGNTCLTALTNRETLDDLGPARNQSKGCGGVMRVAPIGLYAAARGLGPEAAFSLGREVSALTHGHPTGQLPGAVLAMVIGGLVQGQDLPAALLEAEAHLRLQPDHEETLAALVRARALAGSATPSPEALVEIGQGWIAEEALAVALFCALRAGNLEEGVIMAANITGDSDSTAAITGNLLGAAQGLHEIPERWLDKLELRKVIIEMSDDLATLQQWRLAPPGQEGQAAEPEQAYWSNRYPGW